MKGLTCVLCVFLVGISTFAFAETKQIISEKNEHGGKTIMFTYSSGDEFYKGGVTKTIQHFDINGKKVKMEAFPSPELAKKKGMVKYIEYYNDNEKLVKSEAFPTPEFAKKGGSEYVNENETLFSNI